LSGRRVHDATEMEIERALGSLVAASSVYRMELEAARPLLERLSEDYEPATVLVEAVAVAVAQWPLRLGIVRQIETAAATALHDLRG
jgi:hypothetical protein